MGHIQVDVSSGQSDLSVKLRHLGVISIRENGGIWLQKGRDPYLN